MISVLIGSGMRIGECLGLRWCDLDFENRIIDVNHNLVHLQQLTGFCTQEIDGYRGFVFCTSHGTVTIPVEVNRAIHSIVADYNAEETAKAKEEGREPRLLPEF